MVACSTSIPSILCCASSSVIATASSGKREGDVSARAAICASQLI
ncbi:hypothetical protein DO71_6012 [Burkholderia pseudomallei]|nr:hypothetical protein DO71_6012 [Burkholderia pseudomallei]